MKSVQGPIGIILNIFDPNMNKEWDYHISIVQERWANSAITGNMDIKFRDFYNQMSHYRDLDIFLKYAKNLMSGDLQSKEDQVQFDSLERLIDRVKSHAKRNR